VKRRESFYFKALSKVFVLCGINLCDVSRWLLFGEDLGGRSIFRGEFFAVTTKNQRYVIPLFYNALK
jgi:hypothetical protein